MADWREGKDADECCRYMLEKQLTCDVSFEVGPAGGVTEIIQAHKSILISRSPFFYSVFFEELPESDETIRVVDVAPDVFLDILQYIYCDKVELSPDTVLSIIHTSVKYSLTHLTKLCEKWMKDRISSKNVCAFLECAELLNKTELADKARQYIFHNAVDVLLDPTFCELPQDLLKVLLSSDELYVEEEYLYEACMRWARNQCREQGKEATASAIRQVLGQCILLFRFPLMEASKFVTLMDRFPDVLTKDEVVSVLKYFVSGKQTTFSSTPRKDDVVLRAHRFLKVAGDMWSINYGNPDAICFTTDKPVILKGIMVYGNDESFTNELTVEVVDENRATIYNETHKSFHSSGASHSIQFLFDEEVQIFPNKVYAIKQRTRVPKLHYGVNGQESVVSGNVTFHFSQYRLSNGTDVSRGQIPGLLFVRRHIKAFKVVSQELAPFSTK